MKIGIVTYHRTNNYGACLQAVATRFVLEQMGHEVYYVDYWPDYHKEKYLLFPWKTLKKSNFLQKVKFVLRFIKYFKSQKRRIKNFEKFFYNHIYPYCRPTDDYYDVVHELDSNAPRKNDPVRMRRVLGNTFSADIVVE